ncbi:FUSC family protein [Kushneria sp. AK178]
MARIRFRDPYFNYRYRHYLYTLRATIALGITFCIISLFNIPHSIWAPVSTLMVMGNLPHVGGVLDKGGQRLIGTALGGALGIVLLLIPAPSGTVQVLTLVAIAVALHATFTSRYGYSVLMFGITILMVTGDGNQDLTIALWRAFDVLLGTSIGIAITIVVLPQKATDLFRFMLADNLDRLASLYYAHTVATEADHDQTLEEMKKTTSQLIKQRALVDAVHKEGRLRRGELNSLLSLERRMISTVELLLETHWDTRNGHDIIESLEGLRNEQQQLARDLSMLAHQVRTGQEIDLDIAALDLQRYVNRAFSGRSASGRALFSPSGYLWLNRELARQARALVGYLGNIQRLPSSRLRKRASRHHLVGGRRLSDERPDSAQP